MEINDRALEEFGEMVAERVDEIRIYFTNMPEYKEIDSKLQDLVENIRTHMPVDEKRLVIEIEGCFKGIVHLCEKYFYIFGFLDNRKLHDKQGFQ